MPKSKKILAVVQDLFFMVKINDMAKRSGLEVEMVNDEESVLKKAAEQPLMLIVDLNNNAVDAVKLITALKKSAETKAVNIVSFVSHVQGELKLRAQEAGANMVMARSAFSTTLPQILRRHATNA